MTIEQLHILQGNDGQHLLAALTNESLNDDNLLPVLERYRREYPVEQVRAAVELALLRRRGQVKFSRAEEMYFTRAGLEMASAEVVARHTAARFAGLPRVADLCCGIGGDALALAEVVDSLIAVDCDAVALEMASANARAYGVAQRMCFLQDDVTTAITSAEFGPIDGIFIDPSRRTTSESRVSRRPEEYSPALSWCLALTQFSPRVAIKVSPALDYEAALAGIAAEVEIISLRGECKEAVLWLGDFRNCARRATLLPGGATLTDVGPTMDAVSDVGGWLFEPDAACIRAHLVQRLAGEFRLRRIDEEIAYLTGDEEIVSPLLTGYRVQAVLPWSLKRLNAALAARRIGHVVIKKRGFPLTPEQLQPRLKLTGAARATLICTRSQGKPVVIIAE